MGWCAGSAVTSAPGHALHLVAGFHQRVAVTLLAGAAPEIDAQVGAFFGLEPDAGAAQPPHGESTGRDVLLLYLFVQPGAPFGKGVQYPGLAGDVVDFTHGSFLVGGDNKITNNHLKILCDLF